MQTSALQPQPLVDLAYKGTLLRHAELRHVQIDGEGHLVPCICMEVELENGARTPMHVEKLFPRDDIKQATEEAHSLKKGMRVEVQAPLVGLRLVARNATCITPIPEPANDLFQEELSQCQA